MVGTSRGPTKHRVRRGRVGSNRLEVFSVGVRKVVSPRASASRASDGEAI